MTIEEIRELLELFNSSGVGELELEQDNERIRIRKAGEVPEYSVTAASGAAEPARAETSPASPAGAAPGQAEPKSGEVQVKAPIVGTYYDAPSPGAPPFVNVGDQVEPGKVLCIIESMKLMNEIEAEIAGTVSAKLVENGKPVEYGAPLFAIRPK